MTKTNKKTGRPPKSKKAKKVSEKKTIAQKSAVDEVPKRRGRPPKKEENTKVTDTVKYKKAIIEDNIKTIGKEDKILIAKADKDSIAKEERSFSSVKHKLITLYTLQSIDSQIDSIKLIRGELPLEVQDLEDQVEGLKTRIDNISTDIKNNENKIQEFKYFIKDCLALIKKYESQKDNVRNNREFESLSKEIEYQTLEIKLSEKKIAAITNNNEQIKEQLEISTHDLKEREADLKEKKKELNNIIAETKSDEKKLLNKREKCVDKVEERLLFSYNRLRDNARNGLAVVSIERGSCGGCFNKIPPQKQMEIKLHKKIIVCEYCGRILIDEQIVNEVNI